MTIHLPSPAPVLPSSFPTSVSAPPRLCVKTPVPAPPQPSALRPPPSFAPSPLPPSALRPLPSFAPASRADALELAANLRPADALELSLASAGLSPAAAVLHSLACSDAAFAARLGDRLICLFGARSESILDRTASVWLLGSRDLETHYRTFARWTAQGLLMAADAVPWAETLTNAVHAEHRTALRWLAWLGAVFGPAFPVPQPDGPAASFLPFTLSVASLHTVLPSPLRVSAPLRLCVKTPVPAPLQPSAFSLPPSFSQPSALRPQSSIPSPEGTSPCP